MIPEWFSTALLDRSSISKVLNDERFEHINDNFSILMVGTLTSQNPVDDRKNLVRTIKWVSEEFAGEKDVAIILKTNFGKGTTADRKICRDYLKKLKPT